jgi:hypothetical protein
MIVNHEELARERSLKQYSRLLQWELHSTALEVNKEYLEKTGKYSKSEKKAFKQVFDVIEHIGGFQQAINILDGLEEHAKEKIENTQEQTVYEQTHRDSPFTDLAELYHEIKMRTYMNHNQQLENII